VPRIAGVKEASGSLQQVTEIIATAEPGFAVYAGDDVLTLPIMAAGGKGVISVTSNVLPRRMADLAEALLADDLERARTMTCALVPILGALTLEVNPIPVKTALALMGKCAEEFRLPLTCMTAPNRARLERVLGDYGLV
jgi:4-hydroxy-tetrahydrodipicolinate synthase